MLRRPWMIAVLALGWLLASGPVGRSQDPKVHLALGMPKEASDDRANPDPAKFLMAKPLFALSYNSKKGTPNWVSWRLVKEDTGSAARPKNAFHPDDDLPKELFKVKPSHYEGSGFDQGHMCPNADRDKTTEDARQTFVMTNMIPQSPELNQRSWARLEDHCRDLAQDGKEVYIVTGPAGKGGWGVVQKREGKKVVERKKVFRTTLADGKITVPSLCWKVILVIDPGDGEAAQRVTKKSELFAVIMHNDLAPKEWDDFLVPLSNVEDLTGYKFFDKVPAEVMDELRRQDPATHRISQGSMYIRRVLAAAFPSSLREFAVLRRP